IARNTRLRSRSNRAGTDLEHHTTAPHRVYSRTVFAGGPRFPITHGYRICMYGVRSLSERPDHESVVCLKLLPYGIVAWSWAGVCVYRIGLHDCLARNFLPGTIKAPMDSDLFGVFPHSAFVRRGAWRGLHGPLHCATGKTAFQPDWLARAARELDSRRQHSAPDAGAVLEILQP